MRGLRQALLVGLGGLLGLGGCDRVFGLERPRADAAAEVDAPADSAGVSMRLTFQVLESDGSITYPPIAGAVVETGPIDPTVPLHGVPVAGDGTFFVNRDDPTQAFRLVFTANGDVPTELQSKLVSAHLVVPLFGRADRMPAPPGAIIAFSPTGGPASYLDARIFTTGLWTRTDQGMVPGPARSLAYTASAVSLSGSLGSLASAAGDIEVLVNCDANGVALGFSAISVPGLVANTTVAAPSVWMLPPPISLQHTDTGPGQAGMRLMRAEVLGPLYKAVPTTRTWGGVIASAQMPSFVAPVSGGADDAVFLDLSHEVVSPHRFVDPFTNPPLPTALLRRNTDTRTYLGRQLASGFQEIALVAAGATVDVAYDAGIARNVKLAGTTISGTSDGVIVSLASASVANLTFDADRPVDDCVVTLYTIGPTAIAPVRRFLLQQPPSAVPLKIDAAVFSPGQSYVLGIVCRVGYSGVALGDYTSVRYPFSTATLYPAAFTITP